MTREARPNNVSDNIVPTVRPGIIPDTTRRTISQAEEFDSEIDMPAAWNEQAWFMPTLPADVDWARHVTIVPFNATTARDFVGDYLGIRTIAGIPRVRVRAGEVVLMQQHSMHICAWIYLPDVAWYRTRQQPVVRAAGWGRVIKDHVREWVAMPRLQRIIRAAIEAKTDFAVAQSRLHEEFDADVNLAFNEINADVNLAFNEINVEWQLYQDKIEQLERLLTTASGDDRITDVRNGMLQSAFSAWASSIAERGNFTTDEVMSALADSLAQDENDDEDEDESIMGVDTRRITHNDLHDAAQAMDTASSMEPVINPNLGSTLATARSFEQQHIIHPDGRATLLTAATRNAVTHDTGMRRLFERAYGSPQEDNVASITSYMLNTYGIDLRGMTLDESRDALQAIGAELSAEIITDRPAARARPSSHSVRQRLARNIRIRDTT